MSALYTFRELTAGMPVRYVAGWADDPEGRVEAKGYDWVVVRYTDGVPELHGTAEVFGACTGEP